MPSNKRRSLRLKITSWLIVGIILITSGIMVVVVYNVQTSLENELIKRGQAIGATLAKATGSLILENDFVLLKQKVDDTSEFESVSYVIIEDESNRILSDSFNGNVPPELQVIKRQLDYGLVTTRTDTIVNYNFQESQQTVFEILSPVEEGVVGYIRIGLLKSYVDDQIENTVIIILITIALSIILSLIAAFALVKRITQPIVFLTDAADKISMGELSSNLDVSRNDEIGDLGHAIERMRESLKAAIERLKKRQSMRV